MHWIEGSKKEATSVLYNTSIINLAPLVEETQALTLSSLIGHNEYYNLHHYPGSNRISQIEVHQYF